MSLIPCPVFSVRLRRGLSVLLVAALTVMASGTNTVHADGWEFVYGDPGPQNYSRYQIVRSAPTGESYLAGFFTGTFHGLTASDVYRSFVQRIDADGAIAWTVFGGPDTFTALPAVPDLVRDGLGNLFFRNRSTAGAPWTAFSPAGAVIGSTPAMSESAFANPIAVSTGGILQVPYLSNNRVERRDAGLRLVWSFDHSQYFDYMTPPDLAEAPDGTFWLVGTKRRSLPTQADSVSLVHLTATGQLITSIRHFGAVTNPVYGDASRASSVLTVGDGFLWVSLFEASANAFPDPFIPAIWSLSTTDGSRLGSINSLLPAEQISNGAGTLDCRSMDLIRPAHPALPLGVAGFRVVMGGSRLAVVANCSPFVPGSPPDLPRSGVTVTQVLLTYAADGPLGANMRRIGSRVIAPGTTLSAFDADDKGNVVAAGSTTEGLILAGGSGVQIASGAPERAVAVRNPTGNLAQLPDFRPLTPLRLFDTRPTEPQGVITVQKRMYGPGDELRVRVAGAGGVPAAGIAAVSLNVTVTDGAGSGFVTVYPCGGRPGSSNLNFVVGQTVPNAVIAPVSSSGEVCFFTNASAHLLADVNGWFATGSSFNALTPTRLFDTRPAEPQGVVPVDKAVIGGAKELRLKVTNVAGIPVAGVGAVSLNVTVTEAQGSGFVTVYPCGSRPGASSLNFVAGQTVPNAVLTPVSSNGEVCFFANVGVHLLADVNGWFAGGSGFRAIDPARLFDTRPTEPQGTVPVAKQRYGGATELRVKVTDVSGVPRSGVAAVSLNITVTETSGPGFVTVYPCGARPGASNLNFVAGQTVPNAVIAPVSSSGEVCFFSNVSSHLLADVNGWLAV
jgi:hypothetical protein